MEYFDGRVFYRMERSIQLGGKGGGRPYLAQQKSDPHKCLQKLDSSSATIDMGNMDLRIMGLNRIMTADL